MSIASRMICSLAAILMSSAVAVPQKSGDQLVNVTLIPDTSAIVPGKPFTVGVNFKIEPKWHIYWINPGESGAATKVAWSLPPGFTVSELKFPVPERIVLPGDIVSYGYEDEVTLTATITPPADLPPDLKSGGNVSISAKANWLVCEKICLPGRGEAKLDLPVSHSSEPANAELFKKLWFPTPAPANVSAGVMPIDLSQGKGQTEIAISTDGNRELEIFPYPLANVDVSIGRPRVVPKFNLVTVDVSVLPGQSVSAKTWKILVVSRGGANRFAYDVPVTLITKNTDGGADAPSSGK